MNHISTIHLVLAHFGQGSDDRSTKAMRAFPTKEEAVSFAKHKNESLLHVVGMKEAVDNMMQAFRLSHKCTECTEERCCCPTFSEKCNDHAVYLEKVTGLQDAYFGVLGEGSYYHPGDVLFHATEVPFGA